MKRLVPIFALLVASSTLVAQKPAAIELGFKAERVYDFANIDNVNVLNGNNVITIPIGMRYPLTASFSYGLTLVYNSKVWDHRNMQLWNEPGVDYWWAKPNLRSNAGVGWRISLGRLLPPSGSTTTYSSEQRTNWVYEGPSGDEHAFSSMPFSSATTEDPAATFQFTREDPHLRMRRLTSPADTSRVVEFPDGQKHTFTFQNNSWRITRMEDQFGNYVNIVYSYDGQNRVTQWTISDSLARQHRVYFSFSAEMADSVDKGMNVSRVELQGVADENGMPQDYVYTFTRQSQQFPYSCLHDYYDPPFAGAPTFGSTTTLPVLTQLGLPDGTTYTFQYNSTGENCSSGLLSQLILPTRGVISYTYQLYTVNDGACVPTGPSNSSPGVHTRTVDGNVTTYMLTRGPDVAPSYSGPSPANCGVVADGQIPPNPSRRWQRTSILSPPDLDGKRIRSDHYFNVWTAAGFDYDGQFNAGNGTYFLFGEPLTAGWPGQTRAKLKPPEIESADDIDAVDEGSLASNTNRNLSSQLFGDCDAEGNCTTLLRSTYIRRSLPGQRTAYVTTSQRTVHHDDSGCGGTPCYVQNNIDVASWDRVGHFRTGTRTSNFPGVISESTTNSYVNWTDTNARTSTMPWVLERYTEKSRTLNGQTLRSTYCFDSYGRLNRSRAIAGVSEGATDVLTQFGWDGANVIAEWSFGGDDGGIGTGTDVCSTSWASVGYENRYTWANGVLATAKFGSPIDFNSLDYTSDSTGTITASRGSDGLATTYHYDPWGRLQSMTPPAETPTSYTYTNATATTTARVTATRDPSVLSSIDDVTLRYDYDALGRVRRIERTLPGANCVEQEITFDGRSRKSTETIWKACGTTTSKKTSYRYDAFDRLTRITAPDNTESNVAYTGERLVRRTNDVGGFPAITDEEYDAFGRLVRVTEDATSARSLTTIYSYDVGDRLTSATILAPEGTQTRSFEYDGRGFLKSETHPELGILGDGTTQYQYDSRGHVTRKTIGPFSLTYRYDAAERITQIEETGGRVLEQYVYDGYPSLVPTSTSGKLTAAARYHYDSDLNPSGSTAVIHTYHYHADNGRLGLRYTTIGSVTGIPGVSFTSTQTYTPLGQIESIGYPCRTESCSGDERNRTIFNEYKYGSLSGVPGWASSIVYQPDGTIDTVKHGSGSTAILESWTPDPNGMGRPASIQATNNAGTLTLWSTGTYTYDGSGNITNIGATRYSYDAFQRLTGWTTSSVGSTTTTFIGYDSFGNQLYSQTEGCVSGSNGPICFSPGFLPRPIRGTTNRYADAVYDSAGNLTSDEFRTFTYDRLDKITRAVVQNRDFRYLYAPGGERVAAIEFTPSGVVGTFTLRGFDNQLLSVFRTDAGGTPRWSEDIIWRGSAMLAQDTAATGPRHYTLDHLGSPRLITTGTTGLTVGTQSFNPFGDGGTREGGALQFTAHERDAALFGGGLTTLPDYMHARYYDQGTGRFLGVDPVLDIEKAVREPQMWNRYSYVTNNPLKYVDADGRERLISNSALPNVANARANWAATVHALREATHWNHIRDALSGWSNATGAERLMAAGVVVISAADIASWFFGGAEEKAGAKIVGEGAEAIGFKSFGAFKRMFGAAGEGMQWHHIVEQTGPNAARFGPEALHNSVNLVKLDAATHTKVSAYYSSKQSFTGGLTVREWLSKKSFKEQYEFGQQVLARVTK
ncbi:MAG: RHS repeat-associated core domain-containing protein [Thermoanaerobaculia bacterium]